MIFSFKNTYKDCNSQVYSLFIKIDESDNTLQHPYRLWDTRLVSTSAMWSKSCGSIRLSQQGRSRRRGMVPLILLLLLGSPLPEVKDWQTEPSAAATVIDCLSNTCWMIGCEWFGPLGGRVLCELRCVSRWVSWLLPSAPEAPLYVTELGASTHTWGATTTLESRETTQIKEAA